MSGGRENYFQGENIRESFFLPLEHHQGHGACSGSVVIRLSGVQMSG